MFDIDHTCYMYMLCYSAGVGRTGTYIAVDHLMQFVDEHGYNEEIDVFDLVLKLRANRMFMVQTEVSIHDIVAPTFVLSYIQNVTISYIILSPANKVLGVYRNRHVRLSVRMSRKPNSSLSIQSISREISEREEEEGR